jgi:hypothetical protein
MPASGAPTGTANMIKVASTPPRTRNPNFMRNAPFIPLPIPYPYGTGRFPFNVLLVANFT